MLDRLPPARMESLESRRLLTAVTAVQLMPVGLTPQEVRQAYDFDGVEFESLKGKSYQGDGRGQTIAIVSAFTDPTVRGDLRVFDKEFGLPNQAGRGGFALTVATPQGRPAIDPGWAQETALDVEWAHAIAPGARILLVETRTDSAQDLFAGVDYAAHKRGVTVVSMSWGWDTSPAGVDYQDILTTPAKHVGGLGRGDGVTFVEAGSDDGATSAFPDSSVAVVSVGGTTLTLDSSHNYAGETPLAVSASSDTVAYDADANPGFAVYDSTDDQGVQGWQSAGGTSAGAPQWAGLIAIADQGRALLGKHSLDITQTLGDLGTVSAADFHAIPGGGPSVGRGSPFADKLIADLVVST